MVTRRGTVKKTELTAFKRPLGRGIIALGLDEGDQLIGVARTKAGDQVVLSTREGMAIRFDESDVRSMGRPAYGVKGISLADDDEVVGMVVANGDDDPASLLTVCVAGLRQADRPDRVPLAEPGRQGPDRHQDHRPQRPGRGDRQGDRRRRGDADDHRRHHHPHPRRRHQPDRPQHPGRPPDPRRGGGHRQLAGQAPRGGAGGQRRPGRRPRRRARPPTRRGRRPPAPHPRRRRRPRPRPATTSTTSTPTASPTPAEPGHAAHGRGRVPLESTPPGRRSTGSITPPNCWRLPGGGDAAASPPGRGAGPGARPGLRRRRAAARRSRGRPPPRSPSPGARRS